jgi:hypothetical protein
MHAHGIYRKVDSRAINYTLSRKDFWLGPLTHWKIWPEISLRIRCLLWLGVIYNAFQCSSSYLQVTHFCPFAGWMILRLLIFFIQVSENLKQFLMSALLFWWDWGLNSGLCACWGWIFLYLQFFSLCRSTEKPFFWVIFLIYSYILKLLLKLESMATCNMQVWSV